MFQRTMHVLLGTTFVVLLGIQGAWAVSFGKPDVASKMGEPFYAEVPLRLNDSETLSKTSVEIGSAADYRILEVYRNVVLDSIRTDIVDDERGVRVTLTSDSAIDEAFFNVVLKVRYGRSTHYKKIPVFLDVASAPSTSSKRKPLPSVNAANVVPDSSAAFATKKPGNAALAKEAFEDVVDEPSGEDASATGFEPFGEWARTARYGPMVYGDTITTVAQRLRLDDRFTNKQVMVALFEKNRSQFSNDNINLIKAGSYLDVPTAEEVAVITPSAAKQFLSQQTKAWRAMQKQPKFAAIAEAQRNRYSSRVRIGQAATGTASQPVSAPEMNKPAVAVPANDDSGTDVNNQVMPNPTTEANKPNMAVKALEKKLIQKDEAFAALQKKLAEVEGKLVDAQSNSGAAGEVKATAPEMSADSAALEAQNKRLELVITRLKAQLDKAKTTVNSGADSSMADWMLYALIALGAIVLALLIAVFLLMRKGREHPAASDPMLEEDFDDEIVDNSSLDATKVMNADEFEMPAAAPSFAEDSSAEEAADLFGTSGDLEEIPDLTDEETGEMEPFNADEAPDPNVNYLEDAEVYMRYGMEDEAEEQVKMALKLQGDNPEAHAKMVQIQQAKGDDGAVENAMTAAKAVLAGAALAQFETALSSTGGETGAEAEDAMIEDLPTVEKDASDTGDIDIGGIDFDETSDVPLAEEGESADSGIDFDFSEMGDTGDSDEEEASDIPDLDINFDTADIEEPNLSDMDEDSAENLISSELDEVTPSVDDAHAETFSGTVEHDELGMSSLDEDSDVDAVASIDFGEIDLSETAEVELDTGTQLVATDGSDADGLEGLNDHEIDKLKAEAEAEESAASVTLDVESADPFADANQALAEEVEQSGAEDWDIDALDAVEGENIDPLSLHEEQAEQEDDIEGLDVDFDLSGFKADDADNESTDFSVETTELEASTAELDGLELSTLETNLDSGTEDKADSNSGDTEVSLDDMDFDLPDLDADDADETVVDEADATFMMDSDDKDESEVPSMDDSAEIDLDDAAVSLDDLDMDFDLPDLDADDAEETVVDEADATFMMDSDDKDESEVPSMDDSAEIDLDDSAVSLDDLDMDFDLPDLDADDAEETMVDEAEPTFVMDASDESIGDAKADTELEFQEETLDGLDSGMDDLDISTTTVDPINFAQEESDAADMFADLDADLSDLEVHEENSLESLQNEDDLDKTFVLNDVAKNKAMLEEGAKEDTSHHFGSLDDAMEGASSVTDDPMVDEAERTAELENIHTQNPNPMDTAAVSIELDDLMSDLDGLLDEDKDKT